MLSTGYALYSYYHGLYNGGEILRALQNKRGTLLFKRYYSLLFCTSGHLPIKNSNAKTASSCNVHKWDLDVPF